MAQETVVEVLAKFRADTADFNRRLNEVQSQLETLTKKTSDTASSMQGSFGAIGASLTKLGNTAGVVAGVVGGALIAFGVSSFNAAARVQELDVAINAVGKSTGLGYQAIQDAALGIKGMGIEMETAQRSALKFAQNNLKLEYASKLARVAQDLAVISGQNSTDTYNMLTHAVITGRSEVLKSVGIQKSAGQMYEEFARKIGKATSALTFQEKQQAVAEGALKEGAKVFGTYEAAMTSPGKVMRSFARITNDTKVAMGAMVLDGFGPLILAAYDGYKAFSKLVVPGGALYPVIEALTAVFTNLTQPLTDAVTKFTEFASKMKPVTTSISDMGSQISKYLPLILALGTGLAAFAGANLLKQVPIFGQLLGAINPVAAAMVVLIATSPQMRDAFMNLLDALKPMLPVIMDIADFMGTVLNNAIYIVAESINALADFIRSATAYIKEHSTIFMVLGAVLATVGAGLLVYIAVTKVVTAVTKAWAAVQKALNIVMNMNPIGLMVIAITALIAGFIMAWNHSESFRKVIINIGKAGVIAFGYIFEWVGKLVVGVMKFVSGPMRLLLKGLTMLRAPGAKNALEAIEGGIKSVGTFFDKTSDKIKGYADNLDALEKKRFKLPEFIKGGFKLPTVKTETPKNPPGGGTGGDDGSGDGTGGAVVDEVIKNMREVLQKFNDFMVNDFNPGFLKNAETSRNTITKSLDLLKNVFDEQAKGLKGEPLKNMQDAYWKIDESIRQFIPQAEAVGQALDDLNVAIADANKDLIQATQDRADAAAALGEVLKKPFGEPSALTKAMASAESTVDSIIGMYDNLVAQINKRYSKIDPTGKDKLIEFLTNQTQRLVTLARQRVNVAKKLADAQAALDKITQEQASFVGTAKSAMKGFATALVDLSQSDAVATVQVIKTATGFVVTQMKTSSSGITAITDQLRTRLETIRKFATNIKTLMSRGVNKDYLRQLIEAGPEAAGSAVDLMAKATDGQLAEINNLYSGITTLSDSFSEQMGESFFGNAVKSAQGLVSGFESQMESINAEMASIVAAIEEALKPLSDLGTNLGKDLAQGFLDELTKRKTEMVALAKSIADAVAAELTAALASINALQNLPKGQEFTGTPFGQADGNSDKQPYTLLDALKKTQAASEAEYMRESGGINITVNAKTVDYGFLNELVVLGANKATMGRR